MTGAITLTLTADGIDAYCRDLARRAPTLEKRVAALDALITFLAAQTEPGEQAKFEYATIRQTLLAHFEQAREALLQERAERLRQALEARRLPDIAAVYTALSRDGFWMLLGRGEAQLEPAAADALRHWVLAWLAQARQRADDTSPYPDAIDFEAVGIDVAEYTAMTDLGRYLGINA